MIESSNRKTLTEQVEDQLAKLVKASPYGAGLVQLSFNARQLRCAIRSTDRLACEIDSIHVADPGYQSMSQTQLFSCAQGLIERISYLEERLLLIEKGVSQIQIRSELTDSGSDSRRIYSELLLDRDGLAWYRFEKVRGCPRKPIAWVLTRSVLCRLTRDLLFANEN